MPSKKPTQPPAADFSTMEQAWYDNLRRPDGQPYEVFNVQTLTRFKRWVGGEFEFDGTGLRDTVFSNATYLDQVKDDLDAHKAADLNRHQTLNHRIAALEAQLENPPFPA
jgi:hypothetical protein